jgi:cold shock CspA family protein
MATGTVSWLDYGKDCGFIASGDGGTDLFFHSAEVDGNFKTLVVGSSVTFERGDAARGLLVATAVALRTPEAEAGAEHVAARSSW